MYNPLSDLHKMFWTPEFVVFRVEINGKQYLGRPNTIHVKHPYDPGTNQSGIFRTASSVQAFLAGYIDDEIPVTSATVKGIEAIDTIDRVPLDKILAACNDINNIPVRADIGVIRRNIAPMLDRLMAALEAWEHVHDFPRFEVIYEDLDDLKKEVSSAPFNLSEQGRESTVRNMKERVSARVTRVIEMAMYQPTSQPS